VIFLVVGADLGTGAATGDHGVSDLPGKNRWTITESAGDANPHGMQRLLCRADQDAEAVLDNLRGYVVPPMPLLP